VTFLDGDGDVRTGLAPVDGTFVSVAVSGKKFV